MFVEGEHFEVGVDEVGGSPVISYAGPAPAVPAAPVASAAPAPVTPPPAAPAPKEDAPPAPDTASAEGTPLSAPMPGMIIKYQKKVGDTVNQGDTIVVIEAMKMENALPSPVGGRVAAINFNSGDNVAKGEVLAVIS